MAEFSGKYASDVRWYCEQRLSGKVKCNEYQLKGIERFYRDLENDKYEFEYMLLGRMRSDCEYYLGYGNRNNSRLYGNDPKQHIDRMKELWKVFPADKKPEWLTWEQLLNYEKAMCNH